LTSFSAQQALITVIGLVVVIILISSFLIAKPKNPLSGYVKATRSQGYRDEDIRATLLHSGWDEKTVDDALKKK
jgi:hypothetical protein